MESHPQGRRRRRRIRVPVPFIGRRRHGRDGGPTGGEPPFDDWPDGGVREPRNPRPSAPAMAAQAPEPEPPIVAADHTVPPPGATTTSLPD
jgi:hypothetical protein